MTGVAIGIALGIFLDLANRPHIIEVANAQEIATTTPTPEVVLIEVRINWTRDRVLQEVKTAATKYGVSYEKMYKTIECESNFDINIQSHHTLSYGREESWGVSQFHIPSRNRTADGKVITKEMALNPVIALDAMAYHFSTGNARLWTCYRNLYGV